MNSLYDLIIAIDRRCEADVKHSKIAKQYVIAMRTVYKHISAPFGRSMDDIAIDELREVDGQLIAYLETIEIGHGTIKRYDSVKNRLIESALAIVIEAIVHEPRMKLLQDSSSNRGTYRFRRSRFRRVGRPSVQRAVQDPQF
jgi:hypothetical protein